MGPKSLSPAVFEIFGHKYIGVTTLTFLGHVTSSVTWPFESQWVIFYWCSIGPKSLSPSVFEIFDIKHIGVKTLTFLGHVTSSVTWPIESHFLFPIFISYWWSIGPKSLSPSVFEIFKVQKFAKFWPFRGPGDQGVWKVAIFTAKGTSLRESTSIEPFCVKIGWGVWPLGLWGKNHEVSDSHRNDVSPLIQGLR